MRVIDREAWLKERRKYVGGSEIAALFGLSPHMTRFQLWHIKAGDLPEPDLSENERVFWGTILEPAIASGVRELKGWAVMKAEAHTKHPRVEGMAASLDYIVHKDGCSVADGALEIKTVDWLQFRNWEEGEPPLHYQLQLQHQLACTGHTWGAIAVLIGGNDLRVFEYERHEATIKKIEAEVAAFWQSVRENKPPQPDWLADAETIRALYQTVGDDSVDLTSSNRLPILCAAYKQAAADAKEAEARKEAAQAEILTLIDSASLALTKGWRVKSTIIPGGPVSYERKPYRRVTISEIKERANA